MATDPNFFPVFGPNGAVLNAPSMTPEMRAKLEQASRPPSIGEVASGFSPILLIGFLAPALMSQSGSIHDFISSSLWWSGALAGAAAVIAVATVLRSIRVNLRRWEIGSKGVRSLDMPDWSRWLLASVDTVAIAAYVVALAWYLADIERDYPAIPLVVGVCAAALAGIGSALRWAASRLGWKLRKAGA